MSEGRVVVRVRARGRVCRWCGGTGIRLVRENGGRYQTWCSCPVGRRRREEAEVAAAREWAVVGSDGDGG